MPLSQIVRRGIAGILFCLFVACSPEAAESTDSSTSSTQSTLDGGVTTEPADTEATEPVELAIEFESEPFDPGPLKPRGGHTVVWTGSEMLVWGGEADETGRNPLGDGAAYDPAADTWRMLTDAPLSPRVYHEAVWTGSEMLVAGGLGPLEAAAYDPVTDTWRMIAPPPAAVSPPFGADSTGSVSSVWTGTRFIIWHLASGALVAFDPAADGWASMEAPPMPVASGVLRWDGSNLYALGARRGGGFGSIGLEVAILDDDGRWQVAPIADLSSNNVNVIASPHLSAVLDGRIVAWSDSGADGRTVALDLATMAWVDDVEAVPVAACEGMPEPLVADDFILAFSWCGPAAIYHQGSAEWTEVVIDGTGSRRYSVWTGEQVLTWGDTCCYGTGGRPFTIKAWRFRPDGT